jgi:hypothetical protein
MDTCDFCGAPVVTDRETCRYRDHSYDPFVRRVLRELNKPYVSTGTKAEFKAVERGRARMVIA